jgi:hypothetical protein
MQEALPRWPDISADPELHLCFLQFQLWLAPNCGLNDLRKKIHLKEKEWTDPWSHV